MQPVVPLEGRLRLAHHATVRHRIDRCCNVGSEEIVDGLRLTLGRVDGAIRLLQHCPSRERMGFIPTRWRWWLHIVVLIFRFHLSAGRSRFWLGGSHQRSPLHHLSPDLLLLRIVAVGKYRRSGLSIASAEPFAPGPEP